MNVIKADGDWPELKDTLLIAAFSGWNDAADSATSAVRQLGEQLGAEPFATIDPEEFYVFTDTRPQTSMDEDGKRKITWPTNQFSSVSNVPGLNRSVVTLDGVEPDLKWRSFCDSLLEICQRCNVTEVVLLGALVAPVPHTRPVPITGGATAPERLEEIRKVGATNSRYEGPTGIIGVFSSRCQQENIPLVSFWGAAPSYLTASPNWKVTSALLDALDRVLGIGLELNAVHGLARRFENQVSQAVARDEQVAAFVQALEEQYSLDGGAFDDEPMIVSEADEVEDNDTELPSAYQIIQEFEKQLRESSRPENKEEE